MTHPRHLLVLFSGLTALSWLPGCAVIGNLAQLDDDHYRLVRRKTPDPLVAALRRGKHFYMQQRADTLLLTPDDRANKRVGPAVTTRYRLQPTQWVLLLRRRFGLDLN